uniref:transposase n=1 Tax=Escherichia coli TaxID=562 RepID=UPI00201DAAEA|nr:transposase [Escherichia coli]
MQKNVTPGRRKGSPNYPPEFKQQLVAASCEPGISISKLALENGINANLGNDSNLLIVFYVQIMPDDFVMQLHRF